MVSIGIDGVTLSVCPGYKDEAQDELDKLGIQDVVIREISDIRSR